MIKPTPGRVVWFRPSAGLIAALAITHFDTAQPLAADVTYVWDDRRVNLLVKDQAGSLRAVDSVRLLQDDEAAGEDETHAYWMPYQKAQATKDSPAETLVAEPANKAEAVQHTEDPDHDDDAQTPLAAAELEAAGQTRLIS